MTIFITGGAGFIGSNFCHLVKRVSPETKLVIFDALTYAGNLQNLQGVIGSPGVSFVHGSITNEPLVHRLMEEYQPDIIINFAAETHVDRSVHNGGADFVDTNIKGVQILLDATKKFGIKKMIQVSTDEVYGTLSLESRERFNEDSRLAPNSPYSSSKAAGDLLCRSYFETYGTPVLITRCTNNFGPRQFPEKVLPYWITLLMTDRKIPLYGDGKNVRDWIHVNDHCGAIWSLIEKGEAGEIYNIGVGNEWSNKDLADMVVKEMGVGQEGIRYVTDRPAHDRRYALDASKLFKAVGFQPQYSRNKFQEAVRETINWYKSNEDWIAAIRDRVGEFNPHIAPEPKAKVLVLGTGFLGSQYVSYFKNNGYEVEGADRDKMDVTNLETLREFITQSNPDIVINAVAMTDIDWCEKNKKQTLDVNTVGADNVAQVCQELGKYLVHISSGCIQESPTKETVHTEADPVSPVCFYAWTKAFADQIIMHRMQNKGLKALLLRPRQLLSAELSPRNALAKMLSYTKFIDKDNSCTVVDDLLRATFELVEKEATGIINIVNPGVTSPYRIAQQLKRIIKPDMQLQIISKQELNEMTFAQRIDSVLSGEKLRSYGIELASIDQRVPEIITDLKQKLATQEGQQIMGKVHSDTKEKLAIKQREPQVA